MSQESIRERVQREITAILCTALEVRAEEVVATARVIDDLGAESIDLLDIRFGIERSLGLRISNDELSAAFGEVKTAREFMDAFTVGAMVDYLTQRLEATDA